MPCRDLSISLRDQAGHALVKHGPMIARRARGHLLTYRDTIVTGIKLAFLFIYSNDLFINALSYNGFVSHE